MAGPGLLTLLTLHLGVERPLAGPARVLQQHPLRTAALVDLCTHNDGPVAGPALFAVRTSRRSNGSLENKTQLGCSVFAEIEAAVANPAESAHSNQYGREVQDHRRGASRLGHLYDGYEAC